MITKKQAIRHYGSMSSLAKALNITLSAVSQWQETIPAGRSYQLQIITSGKLSAKKE